MRPALSTVSATTHGDSHYITKARTSSAIVTGAGAARGEMLIRPPSYLILASRHPCPYRPRFFHCGSLAHDLAPEVVTGLPKAQPDCGHKQRDGYDPEGTQKPVVASAQKSIKHYDNSARCRNIGTLARFIPLHSLTTARHPSLIEPLPRPRGAENTARTLF
jgi:hypothetical protein